MVQKQIFAMRKLWPWPLQYCHVSRSWYHCMIGSRSNMAVRCYGQDTDFQYVCTVTLTLEIWPWVNVMTHPWVMNNNCVKYPYPTWQWGVLAQTWILGMCSLWPWPWIYDLGSRSWHNLGSWTTIVWNIIQIQHGSEKLWPGHMWTDGQMDGRTDRWMDGRTDRQKDRVIPI